MVRGSGLRRQALQASAAAVIALATVAGSAFSATHEAAAAYKQGFHFTVVSGPWCFTSGCMEYPVAHARLTLMDGTHVIGRATANAKGEATIRAPAHVRLRVTVSGYARRPGRFTHTWPPLPAIPMNGAWVQELIRLCGNVAC